MKRANKCPKCGSKDVIAHAKAIDRGDRNIQKKFSVAVFRNPDALLFKGQMTTTVSAWVCAECGYVELYADSPERLRVTGI